MVPPGKSAWPFHAHVVNEEMIIVIAGEGILRLSDGEQPLRAGDVVALPPGGMEAAHEAVSYTHLDVYKRQAFGHQFGRKQPGGFLLAVQSPGGNLPIE